MGETLTGSHILTFSRLSSGWQDLGYIFTGDENGGDCYPEKSNKPDHYSSVCFSWTGSIEMKRVKSRDWPDFVVHRKGTMQTKSGDLMPATDTLYQFDGKKYVEIHG
jgi:hypothetical protein